MKKIVVMGVGNYILTDEGVGIHVIRELEKMQWPENVEIYDCGTTGILSFHKFVEADILIAIDSIALREEPGTIRVYQKDDIMLSKVPMKISPHQIGFQETLFQCLIQKTATLLLATNLMMQLRINILSLIKFKRSKPV